jgi:hypothetical protein
MGELGRVWLRGLRGVGVTVPVTGGGGNNQAWPLCWPLMARVCGWSPCATGDVIKIKGYVRVVDPVALKAEVSAKDKTGTVSVGWGFASGLYDVRLPPLSRLWPGGPLRLSIRCCPLESPLHPLTQTHLLLMPPRCCSCSNTCSRSLATSLPRSLTPSISRSLAPSLPRSLAPSLPRSFALV